MSSASAKSKRLKIYINKGLQWIDNQFSFSDIATEYLVGLGFRMNVTTALHTGKENLGLTIASNRWVKTSFTGFNFMADHFCGNVIGYSLFIKLV